MRTNYPQRPRRSDTSRGRWGRPGALAAGGMIAAQVWGLGLGATGARAADRPADPAARTLGGTVRAEEGEVLAPVLDGTAGAVGGIAPAPVAGLGGATHLHLAPGTPGRLPELPLPGHRADGPDAFALASRLLSAVPPQSRTEESGRASRSGPANGRPGETETAVPAQRTPAAATPAPPAPPADPAPAPPGTPRPAAGGTPPPPSPTAPATPAPTRLALAAAAPTHPTDTEDAVAVLLPIAAGLLLTAAAMYKHRGLPGGH
ncbi:hypothetical protein ACIQBJ_32455 [Kitasatospora sp. NPDC088391]|uniref:hypothetical protein n=1 Tax=Kitasatospora sp. NPDC088391 TaxID=3364074 RepID=UPI0038290AD7